MPTLNGFFIIWIHLEHNKCVLSEIYPEMYSMSIKWGIAQI